MLWIDKPNEIDWWTGAERISFPAPDTNIMEGSFGGIRVSMRKWNLFLITGGGL